jgi:hypothetical protein
VVVFRLALAAFVVAWLFDVLGLRATVPVWLPFLIAVALELHFFVGGIRAAPTPTRTDARLPQTIDRERYGYGDDADELLLVRRGDRELWIPYAGEPPDAVETLIEHAEKYEDPDPAPPLEVTSRRPLRRLLVGIAIVAALATVVWLAESRTGWNGLDETTRRATAARLSGEATRIAGHAVVIRCDESGAYVGAVQHADGVAEIGGRVAYLTPARCYDLYRVLEGDASSSQTARAVAVLAHEAWHLRGARDEGVTECYALQSGVELGQRLGLSERRARQLMRQQLAENALRARGSVEYLVPAECRDGGTLDLDPRSTAFP